MSHVWIEHKIEYKIILRLSQSEAKSLRTAIQGATEHLALSPDQLMICHTLVSALGDPECPRE